MESRLPERCSASPTFVFLLYVSRSGSTPVARLLQEHGAGIVAFPENRITEFLLAQREITLARVPPERVAKLIGQDPPEKKLGLSASQRLLVGEAARAGNFRGALETLVKAYAGKLGLDVRSAIIKHGMNLFFAERLFEHLPRVFFVHVLLDGRAAASSTLRSRNPYLRNERLGRGGILNMARMGRDYIRAFDR